MADPFPAGTRAVVIHEDDVGVSHGGTVAFAELSALGTCTSGSVMVPCPWFPEVAELARSNPALDLGVHLTLNSEMPPYRWRPLTGVSDNGLTDPAGYFWLDVASARRHAKPEAVDAELRAQIDAALAAGIDVTHLDAHMGTVTLPEFVDIYWQLGVDYDLPVLLVKDYSTYNPTSNTGPVPTARYDAVLAKARASGHPVFDLVLESPWDRGPDAAAAYSAIFSKLPEGLTFLSYHFNAPGDIDAAALGEARIRTEEYALFKTATIPALIKELGLTPIGMRQFRDEMRS